ncbi:MAG: AbrB/MazE/SpoVT family DNA-binding domain-containing protein [Candidatus Altiarchaeota archaeon]
MAEVCVTRNGQITLSKGVRDELNICEGDKVIVNMLGDGIYITKKAAHIWDTARDFLPENFKKTMSHVRSDYRQRLKDVGVLE